MIEHAVNRLSDEQIERALDEALEREDGCLLAELVHEIERRGHDITV
jgi:DNA-binding phage protein